MRLVSVGGQQRGSPFRRYLADFVEQVVDLHVDGPDLHLRVDQARGADDLFGEDAACLLQLPIRRRG
jgi:hypothetical protein